MSVKFESVGAYTIRRRLGSGGMADVYEAVDTRDGRVVALKIPKPDPEVRAAEREGARLQERLSRVDPRVPRVWAIDEAGDELLIAMEYIEGEDLSTILRRGPLPPGEAARIAIELCDHLAIAQKYTSSDGERTNLSIVHGDLKPRNVRIASADRSVRVLDFGIAKALSATRRLTRNPYASPHYCSPERIDSRKVDLHSDLWAVSVVLFEMVSGRQPFVGENTRELEDRIRLGAEPEPLPAGCPSALAEVLRKALEPQLARRYPDAESMRDDLRAFLAGLPTVAAREAATERTAEATRRTIAPNGSALGGAHGSAPDGGATRRTLAPAPAAAGSPWTAVAPADVRTQRTLAVPPPVPASPLPPPPPAARRAPMGFRLPWRTLLVVALLLPVANEVQIASAAHDLEGELPTLQRADANGVLARLQRLRSRSFLRVGVLGCERSVRRWLVSLADVPISAFRSEHQVVWERNWKDAVSLLERAVAISPDDGDARSKLEYCRGQIARINAEADQSRKRQASAGRLFSESERHFRAAIDLRPRWGDPFVGLARVFAYGSADPVRTQAALEQARKAGLASDGRYYRVLGDAYRLRADKLWADADFYRGRAEEPDFLQRVRGDAQSALGCYQRIPEVKNELGRVYARLDQVTRREQELAAEPLE